jgi:mono/diheme cytochrome c family protein
MVTAKRLLAGLGSVALIAAVCTGQSAFSQSQSPGEPAADASAAPADPALATAMEAGRKEYMKNCRTCHGSKGTAGVPLAKNPKVVGNPGYLVWAILTGPGYMPEFAPVLSNEQIAAIATFVEHSWGDSSGIVTPDDVQASR